MQSRNLREISAQYPELAFLHRQVKKAGTILDGEIIALADGKPSFQRLTSRMHLTSPPGIRRGMRENPVLYVAFDLLYYDGRPLLQEPCQKRQELLQAVVTPGDSLLISTGLPEQGRKLFQLAAEQGLEGVMGKEKDSPYLPGKRSPFWKKIRVTRSAPFLICGYTTNPAGRRDLSALILGAYAGEGRGRAPARTVLRPCGLVGAGLSQEEIDHLLSGRWQRKRPGHRRRSFLLPWRSSFSGGSALLRPPPGSTANGSIGSARNLSVKWNTWNHHLRPAPASPLPWPPPGNRPGRLPPAGKMTAKRKPGKK